MASRDSTVFFWTETADRCEIGASVVIIPIYNRRQRALLLSGFTIQHVSSKFYFVWTFICLSSLKMFESDRRKDFVLLVSIQSSPFEVALTT